MHVSIPSRNSPCSCGSGRRFKQCCGAAQPAGAQLEVARLSPEAKLDALFADAFRHHQQGDAEAARRGYEQVLAQSPAHGPALHYLGMCHYQDENFERAAILVEQALAIDADAPMLQSNLGLIYRKLGRDAEACACFDRAIAHDAHNAWALNNRGLLLHDRGDLAAAADDFARAIAAQPAFVEAHVNLVRNCLAQHLNEEALAAADAALRIDDRLAIAHALRGSALRECHRFDEALASWQHALAIDPTFASVECDLGGLLQTMHRHREAAAAFGRAFALRPNEPYLAGDLLHNRMHCCDWRDYNQLSEHIRDGVDHGRRVAVPFQLMMCRCSAGQLQQCARILSNDRYRAPRHALRPAANEPHARIRVVFLSADFRDHPTAHLFAGVLEQLDHRRFELIAVYCGPASDDPWHARLQRGFDRFIEVGDESDETLAQRLRALEADIILDLMGHTALARTAVLAYRPAPVQVNYLGFPGTMGAPFIDYLIADATLVPDMLRSSFDEHIAYLPGSYQPNDGGKALVGAAPGRAQCGLPAESFVFCCFNGHFKITPDVFDCWMQVLAQVEHSVLWLLAGEPQAAVNLRAEAERRGISGERLVFAPRLPLARHLARHANADLFLDTFHCNAHTTASDALWAGLPALTCAGATLPGRVAASLLNAVGLPELVTESAADYVSTAVALARSPGRLASLRMRLDGDRLRSPLFDTAAYARHFESALSEMHRRQQAGLAAEDFVIAA